jgi:glycosyltransferase involved in cell wall biosynthesis
LSLKIVHLLISGEVAGGQAVALRLARGARARGDSASFVAPADGPFADAARADGFAVATADLGRTYRLGGAIRLRGLLRGADLLHTHTLAAANAMSTLASPVPVVRHLHIENHFRAATAPLLRRLDNWTARRCAALVAVSEDTRRAYLEQGYPDRIEIVYNGIDLGAATPPGRLRAELGIPDGAPLVGEVARLCDVKGQRELIEALAEIPDARLVLFGRDLEQGGAFQTGLEQTAERLGVRDRVVFAGHRDDAARLIGDLDVLALPSWTEGLPVVALEAMAQRRAVVATPVGGTPEVVTDGETGLLVPPRDPRALAAAIRDLLADPERRRRMGEAGYRRAAERFSAETMTRRVLEIYDRVSSPRPPRPEDREDEGKKPVPRDQEREVEPLQPDRVEHDDGAQQEHLHDRGR